MMIGLIDTKSGLPEIHTGKVEQGIPVRVNNRHLAVVAFRLHSSPQ
jgi:hypothetical protein